MRLEDIEFKDQRALTIITDLRLQLDQSYVAPSEGLQRANARAVITNASLLLECVANSSLLSLAIPSKLGEELDRLSTISKLDYYLFAVVGKHIDRGCREVEIVADVLKLRDHVVHPKPKSGKLSSDPNAPYVVYGATKALSIPFDTREWNCSVALRVAQAVTKFLLQFFLKWCVFDKGRVTTILASREKMIIQGSLKSWVSVTQADYSLIKKWLPEIFDLLEIRDISKVF